ncbi:hypothetical protein niasHS_009575 [Heterodera schachtii]|uniref:Uncharacterized protein n=1 Tax=Heterodera schachtii TaxID=97005 RepID=A0ABD2JB99_HETSC
MENYEVPPRESFDGDEEYEEARRLGVARVRADEEKARIKMPNEHSSLFKADEFGSTRKFSKQRIDAQRILALHHTIMVGKKERAAAAGVYRLTDLFVGDDPIGVPPREIPDAEFCRWLKEADEALNGGGGELARFVATAHLRF